MPRGIPCRIDPANRKAGLFRFCLLGRRGFGRRRARAIEPEDRLPLLHDPEFVPRDGFHIARIGFQQMDFPLSLLLQELLSPKLAPLFLQLCGELVAVPPLRVEHQADEQDTGKHDQNRQEPVKVMPDGGVAALFRLLHSG